MFTRHIQMVVSLLLASGLAACSGAGSGGSLPSTNQNLSLAPQSTTNNARVGNASVESSVPAIGSTSTMRTTLAVSNVGTSATNSAGINIQSGGAATGAWVADTEYSGGYPNSTGAVIDVSHVTTPAPQSIYQSNRYGKLVTYTVAGLSASTLYPVRLHFAETYWTAAGHRSFNVSINGYQVLTKFDVFAIAGGKNVATAKTFSCWTDSSGKMTIVLTATTDNAFVSGIQIGGTTSTPAPTPSTSPTAAPTAAPAPSPTPAPQPSTAYPIFSSLFRAADNPFHMSVSSLVSRGAQRQSQTLMTNLWRQGYYTEDSMNYPLYQGKSGQTLYSVKCTFWGNCNPNGYSIHLPAGAYPEAKGDHHLVSVDAAQGFEFDGWGGASTYGGGACSIGGTVNCSWGGFYPFSGKGLTNSGYSGDHAGFALGLFSITAQELLQGHIDHALGINAECLDNPSVYPAALTNGSDQTCAGVGTSPAPGYGMMVHLLSSYNVSASGYSPECKTILTAMQTYGGYLYDTGNQGLYISLEDPQVYSGTNPWYSKIYPEMAAYGDASGSGQSWGYSSCLKHVSSANFEVYTVPNLGY